VKLNRLETHDRYEYFTKQAFSIGECCQDLIDQKPFGDIPFYIFAHTRTDDDGVTKRLIWQPRLTKPRPQENSMLFKGYPGSDMVKVIWMIPAKELWKQYERGKMTENKTIMESITAFKNDPAKLGAKEEDDLPDDRINKIYEELSKICRGKSELKT